MLVDLRPKRLDRQGRRRTALGRAAHHLQQERHPLRSGEADGDLRHPARHAGRHHARLRRRRVPAGRRADRRGARRAAQSQKGAGAAGRGGGARSKVQALTAPLPDLPAERRRGRRMRCPYLRQPRHPGEGFAADRGLRRDPPPARLPRLRRPLHHLRARAAARADRGQAQRPPRAVRPRQAGALDRRSRCASAPVEPERIERMVIGIVRELESVGESEIVAPRRSASS